MTSLEEQIDYANSSEYVVSVVSTNNDWGTITSGGGDHTVKVTDSINLNYSINDGYKFIKWKAVSKSDNSVSMEDYVKFTDKDQATASVKIIKGSSDIMITPLCAQIFKVKESSVDSGQATYSRDHLVTLTFTQNLAEPTEDVNNIDNIKIAVSGISDAAQYFNKPVISDNRIIISCKPDNLIPVAENTTRTVMITIPKDFCCFIEDYKMVLSSENDYVLTYLIDSSTTEKSTIKFTKEENGDSEAVFSVDGVIVTGSSAKYSIGQIISLSYKNTADYVFVGFSCDVPDAILFSESEYDEGKNLYTATATVIAGGQTLTVFPVVTLRDKLSLKFAAENGTVSPSEQKSIHKDEEFEIRVTPAIGYTFYEWELFDIQNQIVNISDYLKLDTKKSEQKIKVIKGGTALTLKAVCKPNPQVKLIIPNDGKEGLVRNSTIKILFTQPMKPETLTDKFVKVSQGLLRATNQQIVIDAEDAASILEYTVNSTNDLLTIKLKDDNLFQSNAYVYVTVTTGVEDSFGIPFAQPFEAKFQVNTTVDSLAPVINTVMAGVPSGTSDKEDDYKKFKVIKYKKDTAATKNTAYSREIGNSKESIKKAYKDFITGSTFSDENPFIIENTLNCCDLVKIYVDAGDISGVGLTADTTQNEGNVSEIHYIITNPLSINNTEGSDFIYDNFVPYNTDKNELKGKSEYQSGTTFTLNLNDLDGVKAPDGILRIDFYATDIYNNNSYDEPYWYYYGNGYQTLYLLKESRKPEISKPQWKKTTDSIFETSEFEKINGVKNCAELRFEVDEDYSGFESLEVELVDSGNNKIEIPGGIIIDSYTKTEKDGGKRLIYTLTSNSNELYTNSHLSFDVSKLISTTNSSMLESGIYSYLFTVTDGAGNKGKAEYKFAVDNTPPEFVPEGPKVTSGAYSTTHSEDKFFPRPGKYGISAQEFHEPEIIKNADEHEIRWFYTNACDSNEDYGIYLSIPIDTEGLFPDQNITIYHEYYPSTLEDAELNLIDKQMVIGEAASGKTHTTKLFKVNANKVCDADFYKVGTHSIVLVDDAGNISDKAFTFVVVRDNKRPEKVTSEKYYGDEKSVDGNDFKYNYPFGYDISDYNRDLKYLFTLSSDATVTWINDFSEGWTRSSGNKGKHIDWWAGNYFNVGSKMVARKCIIAGTEQQIKSSKYIMQITGTKDNQWFVSQPKPASLNNGTRGPDPKSMYDSVLVTHTGEYWPDAWPSRNSSGIAQYYIARTYNGWRNSTLNPSCLQPTFPKGTDLSGISKDVMKSEPYLCSFMNDFTCCDEDWARKNGYDPETYFNGGWVNYNVNVDGDIEIPIWRSPYPEPAEPDKPYHYSMPIAVCFKDGCGNLSFVNITKPTWNEYAGFAYRFDFAGVLYD